MEVVGQTESKPRAGPDGWTMGLSPKANGIEDVAPSWPMRGGAHECEEVTHPARGVQIEPQRADSSGGCNVLATGGAMGIGRDHWDYWAYWWLIASSSSTGSARALQVERRLRVPTVDLAASTPSAEGYIRPSVWTCWSEVGDSQQLSRRRDAGGERYRV